MTNNQQLTDKAALKQHKNDMLDNIREREDLIKKLSQYYTEAEKTLDKLLYNSRLKAKQQIDSKLYELFRCHIEKNKFAYKNTEHPNEKVVQEKVAFFNAYKDKIGNLSLDDYQKRFDFEGEANGYNKILFQNDIEKEFRSHQELKQPCYAADMEKKVENYIVINVQNSLHSQPKVCHITSQLRTLEEAYEEKKEKLKSLLLAEKSSKADKKDHKKFSIDDYIKKNNLELAETWQNKLNDFHNFNNIYKKKGYDKYWDYGTSHDGKDKIGIVDDSSFKSDLEGNIPGQFLIKEKNIFPQEREDKAKLLAKQLFHVFKLEYYRLQQSRCDQETTKSLHKEYFLNPKCPAMAKEESTKDKYTEYYSFSKRNFFEDYQTNTLENNIKSSLKSTVDPVLKHITERSTLSQNHKDYEPISKKNFATEENYQKIFDNVEAEITKALTDLYKNPVYLFTE